MIKNKILLIEICNYADYPIGGYLSFAKQMMTAFGDQLALVGMTTDDTPVGRWVKKEFNGISYDFFSVRKFEKSSKKPFIPARLKSYFAVKKYKRQILGIGIKNVFIQTPEVLFALNDCDLPNLCARIPGVENPLSISRYWYGKIFSKLFDYYFFRGLKRANVILASADKNAITAFLSRGDNIISSDKVIQFPTRVNTDIFKPVSKDVARTLLGIDSKKKIIATTGRLSSLKGWKFMLECFMKFKIKNPGSLFMFLGDGEDRPIIEEFVKLNNLDYSVFISGRLSHERLALYLSAADLYVMGSYVEGWATSLVEAIACGKPIVCTNFSSSRELVDHGFNGFILENRDIESFVSSIEKCFNIPQENLYFKSCEMHEYSSSKLKSAILSSWLIN
ncbi:MAG: glycosyltransferase [Desulfuromonadales bacterium]|nr:glycosyltransferase [Desulfuromonadales bacterium]